MPTKLDSHQKFLLSITEYNLRGPSIANVAWESLITAEPEQHQILRPHDGPSQGRTSRPLGPLMEEQSVLGDATMLCSPGTTDGLPPLMHVYVGHQANILPIIPSTEFFAGWQLAEDSAHCMTECVM